MDEILSPGESRRRRAPAQKSTSAPDIGENRDRDDLDKERQGAVVETDIPARLDGLPWGRFHTLVVVALGITWILDGLEVTLTGALSGVLKENSTLGLSNTEVGLASSAYLGGAVLGGLLFGWLTDRLGRKKLFFITLAVYLAATAATATSWNFWSFALFRAATGAGIGGEGSAIASTIQELIPARMRGWTDLVINGSFWIGDALGAAGSIILLDPANVDRQQQIPIQKLYSIQCDRQAISAMHPGPAASVNRNPCNLMARRRAPPPDASACHAGPLFPGQRPLGRSCSA